MLLYNSKIIKIHFNDTYFMSDKETSDLIGQRRMRIDKLKRLRDMGFDPYPAKSYRSNVISEIVNNFEKFENTKVSITGRVMSWRTHGHIIFADIQDENAQIQLYIKDDTLEETSVEKQSLGFIHLDLIDIGDFIEATGDVVKTQSGQISVCPKQFKVLSKAIRPLPSTRDGVLDKEEKYRRRYVDMALNKSVRDMFKRRAAFWQAQRDFFNSQGFSEINIPVLEHIPGGGDAVPFVTHMNAIDEDLYLRISHELPLKRLIGGGLEKVYDIGARFRNEGLSDEHLPEHVAMEFYWAYADWKDGMKLVQDMFNYIIERVYNGRKEFKIRGFDVKFTDKWDVLDFNQIMQERFGIKDVYTITLEEVVDLLKKNNLEVERGMNIPRGVDKLWKQIRKTIAGPAFLINHPKYLSPLQKPSLDNPLMVERFQQIIAGSELGNGWTEVNDAIDQYDRFMEQQKLRDSGDAEAQWLDIDYVEMLEYGMPPTFGYGHSERVFWFLEDVTAREGVPFPTLKFHVSELTKKIYPEVDFANLRDTENDSDNKSDEIKIELKEDITGLLNREEALSLLESWVSEPYQILHAKMVANALEMYAEKFNGNKDLWYITGLLHDLDYGKHPEEHPNISLEYFKSNGFPEILTDAVAAHAWMRTGVKPNTQLAKALVATDEMSGLLYAYSLVRGADKFKGMEVKSALKRFREAKFAAKINREEIQYGVDLMGITLEEHVGNLIEVFQKMEEFI